MTELKILYTCHNDDSDVTYLYEKKNKVLLPIESDKNLSESNLHIVLKTLFSLLNVQNASFEIYKCQDEIYYSYLNLKTKAHNYKINCGAEVFSFFAEKYHFPVFTNDKILNRYGIPITEEMLEPIMDL